MTDDGGDRPGRPRSARRSELDADPTAVRNQPALRTSSGTQWLVVGLVLGAISAVVLLLQGSPLTSAAAALVGALVAAMVVVRFAVRPGRPRLFTSAVLLIGVPVVALAALLAEIIA